MRFKLGQEETFGGSNNGKTTGFFSLRDDGDNARVRFLWNGVEDVEGFAVHQIDGPNGKKRYVNCIREAGDSQDVCPFCAAGMFTAAKFFIPLYNEDTQTTQIWERGKQFGGRIGSLCSHYPNLVGQRFEIERRGKKGDTSTSYEIYADGPADDTRVEDFDEVKILGGLVLDWDSNDMQTYLMTGEFPNKATGVTPRQRRTEQPQQSAPQQNSEYSERPRRRPMRNTDGF